MRRGSGIGRRPSGFALLAALALIALASAGAMTVVTQWTTNIQREKEAELLRVGDLYAGAIASYYLSSPGSTKRYPPDLYALIEDARVLAMRRHLRSAYADPITGSADWGIVRAPDGGIKGVFSKSEAAPWLRVPTALSHVQLPAATRYSDWKFVAKVE